VPGQAPRRDNGTDLLYEEVKKMAVKIRLKKMGAKKNPFYRIVAADSRSPRDGRFIESIGYYDSTKQPASLKIDADKAIKWLSQGAQATDTVRSLFQQEGILAKWHTIRRTRPDEQQ
jgi:small subunit ribosomal protein S16